uniref:Retrotransposon gag domain-containing protein n=1 Tax=Plectus sambesii TaxID=2011161 RepID=A0A914WZV6_9BILA
MTDQRLMVAISPFATPLVDLQQPIDRIPSVARSLYVRPTTEFTENTNRAVLISFILSTFQKTLIALISPRTTADGTYKELFDTFHEHYKVTPPALTEYFDLFSTQLQARRTYSEFSVHLRTFTCT